MDPVGTIPKECVLGTIGANIFLVEFLVEFGFLRNNAFVDFNIGQQPHDASPLRTRLDLEMGMDMERPFFGLGNFFWLPEDDSG